MNLTQALKHANPEVTLYYKSKSMLKKDLDVLETNYSRCYEWTQNREPGLSLTVTRKARRQSKVPQRFQDETFLPGSNNGYTAGRAIDSYDRDYDG